MKILHRGQNYILEAILILMLNILPRIYLLLLNLIV